jgi:hypothetical protein
MLDLQVIVQIFAKMLADPSAAMAQVGSGRF